MLEYWTKGGKIALVAFIMVGVIGLPAMYYAGSTLNDQAYDVLNSQYVVLMNRYEDLSQLYDMLLIDHIGLQGAYDQLQDNTTITWNLVAYWRAQVVELTAIVTQMEVQLDLYVGLIRNMPFHERLIIWSNAVRVYTYQERTNINLHAVTFMLNMTKHNSNLMNNYDHIDQLLSSILGFADNNSMFEMYKYMSDHVVCYDSNHTREDIYNILNMVNDAEYDGLTGPWNYTYMIKSSLETYFERGGDDIDLTIFLASCLASSGYTTYIALDLNDTMYYYNRRAFLFVNEPTNPCADWTIGGISGWVLLDLADGHLYDKYPLWLESSYVAVNNTDWVDTELEYRYKIEVS